MTKTLGLNSRHDIYLGADGNLVMIGGEEAVAGACETASLAQLGEMVLATQAGVPNFQAVWIGTSNLPLWKQYLLNTLLNVNGVVAVPSITANRSGNVLSYTATIESQYGKAAINGVLPLSN